MGLVCEQETLGANKIQKSTFEINKESMITMLNMLSYLSDSRHLKVGMCMKWLNYLRFSIGNKPPVLIGTTNTLEEKSAPPFGGLMVPLANSSSTSFWITGWWAAGINVEPFEIMEQQKTGPKLKIVTLNHIKYKPIEMLLHWSKTGEMYQLHNRWRCWWSCGLGNFRNAISHGSVSL